MSSGEFDFVQQRRIRLWKTFNLEMSDQETDELFDTYLEHYTNSWRLLPGADYFLEKTSHIPRVILTNSHKPQAHKKLERVGLTSMFDGVVTPEDCGTRKPHADFFHHALDLTGLTPDEVVMIGDNEEFDIEPAMSLGMQVFHIRSDQPGCSIKDALKMIESPP